MDEALRAQIRDSDAATGGGRESSGCLTPAEQSGEAGNALKMVSLTIGPGEHTGEYCSGSA